MPDLTPSWAIKTRGGWTLRNDHFTPEVERTGSLLCCNADIHERALEAIKGRTGPVLDVGAFVGSAARFYLDYGYKVIAFEPRMDAFWCLTQNCPEADCRAVAVGNGETVMMPEQDNPMLGSRQVFEDEEAWMVTTHLDGLNMDSVALLKIDVEGYEPKVLEGATNLLKTVRPPVLIEINDKALSDHGFSSLDIFKHFRGWNQQPLNPGTDPYDILFTPHL